MDLFADLSAAKTAAEMFPHVVAAAEAGFKALESAAATEGSDAKAAVAVIGKAVADLRLGAEALVLAVKAGAGTPPANG